jgi:hypothetical protein
MEMDEIAANELKAMRGAWRAVRGSWDLSDREVRELLPEGGEEAQSPPRDTEQRMRLMIEISYRLPHGIEDHSEWLRTASPMLGWLSPLDVMSAGMAELRAFRRMAEGGHL